MKKILGIFIVLASCLLISGCEDIELTLDQTFTADGFEITLTNDFVEREYVGLTKYYQSAEAIVTVVKETFVELEELGVTSDTTLEEYSELVSTANETEYDYTYNEIGNYYSFNFLNEVSGNNYYYYGVMKKGEDAFWLIQFACFEGAEETYQPLFEEWARSIKLD